jgi:hypothetical protein
MLRRAYPSRVVHLGRHHSRPARHIGQVLQKLANSSCESEMANLDSPDCTLRAKNRRRVSIARNVRLDVGPERVWNCRACKVEVGHAFTHTNLVGPEVVSENRACVQDDEVVEKNVLTRRP